MGERVKKIVMLITTFAGGVAFATVGDMAASVTDTFAQISNLVGGAAYLAGLLFVAFGLVKFKQHRDNPQQTPVATPFTLCIVGVLLIFMQNLVTETGSTIYSSGGVSGGASGEGFDEIGISDSSKV